ncbi:MAG: hypothetical protein KU37_06720 [Sulfuricurvum sp. PC08-66]|nr:MAG: hypothetical protein KU37_06720 [Sulfuricurvum sp. PC08-66]
MLEDSARIAQYRPILDKDNFQPHETHWRSISKNATSLFQVLIDNDLRDLVMVLEHYPRYTEWVCEHFRYAYSYSETHADIDAASTLLTLGEPFFFKQFVRNVVRKLPRIDDTSPENVQTFVTTMASQHTQWHPIITNHYLDTIHDYAQRAALHPLQRIVLLKPLSSITRQETFDYEAEDRDAVLDIPYMT